MTTIAVSKFKKVIGELPIIRPAARTLPGDLA
jgi:hypothetical protein